MNPQAREAEPASLIVSDIANAPRPKRGVGGILGMLSGLIALYGTTGMAPRIVFGQTGPDQKDEQLVDPNQFTDPMVAGVLAEAEADIPAENTSVGAEAPLDSETILASLDPEPIITPTPAPAATPTPEPTPILPSSPWLPEVAEMLKSLTVVDGLRLIQVNPDIRSIVPCGQEGACYNSTTKTAYIEVGSPVGGMKHAQAHEVCHSHQHWSILQAGLGEPNPNLQIWLNTPEGKAFKAASDQILRGHQTLGRPRPWENFGENLVEDFANVCPAWYIDFGGGAGNVGPQPLVDFAKQWLPK